MSLFYTFFLNLDERYINEQHLAHRKIPCDTNLPE